MTQVAILGAAIGIVCAIGMLAYARAYGVRTSPRRLIFLALLFLATAVVELLALREPRLTTLAIMLTALCLLLTGQLFRARASTVGREAWEDIEDKIQTRN